MNELPVISSCIPKWKQILRQSFNRVEQLVNYLELDSSQCEEVLFNPKFPILVPIRLARKMEKRNLDDPLVLQFLPIRKELEYSAEFTSQPVCDNNFQETEKLLHKYHGRVLLLCTNACAMHCRYCFRQNFDYAKVKLFEKEIEWIANDSSISEVILSGGDPFSLSNDTLQYILEKLGSIKHVKRIRFHTRFLIGVPERVDEEILSLISSLPQQVYIVIHCNHPNELDDDVFVSLQSLQKVGCLILNQAVLLKGVNDHVDTLVKLCLQLSDKGILPYYLHQLDKVEGAAHFEVLEETGRYLITEIAKQLPGYAVPKYAREIPGQPNKTLL